MCSWRCGGCGKWYSYAVSCCDCSKYLHIETSTDGSAPTPTNNASTAKAQMPPTCPECPVYSGCVYVIKSVGCLARLWRHFVLA
jgi:hypothetical protein